MHKSSVREIQPTDIPLVINYWRNSPPSFLEALGVDLSKIPSETELKKMLMTQITTPYEEKQSFCMIWVFENQAVGHSNINKIQFGDHAFMHLHLWDDSIRKKGLGSEFVKLTIPYFFKLFKLKKLFCEPYSKNPAPNKTLARCGFKLIDTYTCVPGSINFEQEVNLWTLENVT